MANNTDKTDRNTDHTDTNKKGFLHKDLCYEVLGCVYDVRNTFGNGQKEKLNLKAKGC